MATENWISDLDQTLSEFRRRSGKRRRISSPISKLGDDLLQEILIRLPNPRVACLCKLVCKRWSFLISSPRFNRLLVSHHQTMSLNHAPMPDNPFELQSMIRSFLPLMPSLVQSSLRVLDCNRDLVLCGFWDVHCKSEDSSRSYLVCNPFSKQWIALPLAPMRYARYQLSASRLVCEPRASVELDLGDGQAFIYWEHRFRVVCVYQEVNLERTIKLDVFCSESGEWSKEAFVLGSCDRIKSRSVISCNGELFLKYDANNGLALVAGFNPFRLDMPPISIDVSAFLVKPQWFISNSQGALHVIALEDETLPTRASVWRLGEEGKSWRKQCEGLVNGTSMRRRFEVGGCFEPFLHPHKPELVFFSRDTYGTVDDLMCCDLGRELDEPKFFAKLEFQPDIDNLQVFQPRVSCWATPIPKSKQQLLQGMCGGSSFWAESSRESAEECPSLHILNNCMDRVVKSSLYRDYMDCVISEATLALLDGITFERQKDIKEIVFGRRLVPGSPYFDSELDVLVAASNVVRVDRGAIIKQKAELKQKLEREMAAELPHPPGPMKSIFWREPYCGGGLNPIPAVIRRAISSLKFEDLPFEMHSRLASLKRSS